MMATKYEMNEAGEWIKVGMVPCSLNFGTAEVKYDRQATGKNSNEGQSDDQQIFDK
jgi:hypothetical protein